MHPFRILAVNPNGDLTLNETTIRQGVISGSGSARFNGGGVFNNGGRVTITNSTLSHNRSGRYGEFNGSGGGIFNNRGVVTIDHSALTHNTSFFDAGAMFNDQGTVAISHSTISGNFAFTTGAGIISNQGQVTIAYSPFSGNGTYNGSGGSLTNNGGRVTIDHSTFTHNSPRFGGDIINGSSGVLTMTHSAISGHSSRGATLRNEGTMILAQSVISGNSAYFTSPVGNGGRLTITHSDISGNSANGEGAGGGISNNGVMTVTHSTVLSNSASGNPGPGGGVNNSGLATLVNSTVSGNSGQGAVYNTGQLSLTNSTVSGNPAGGLVNEGGALKLHRSLVAGNASAAVTGAEIQNSGEVTAADHNLFGHAGLSNAQAFDNFIPGPTDVAATSDGSTPTPLDHILEIALADNGGETQTHALVSGSPAIDAAPGAACEAEPVAGLDQRDRPRNADGNLRGDSGLDCDIGAVEFQPGHLTIVKKLPRNEQLSRNFLFEGPTGVFTLTTNTAADRQTFDLLPETYTFREILPHHFALLGVICLDDQDQDVTATVVDDLSSIEASADIILTESDDLTCTFFNEKDNFKAGDEDRFYLPLVIK